MDNFLGHYPTRWEHLTARLRFRWRSWRLRNQPRAFEPPF